MCIVYAVDDEDSLDKVTSYWLPLVRKACSNEQRRPVVLVGNKVDLVDYSTIDVSHPFVFLCLVLYYSFKINFFFTLFTFISVFQSVFGIMEEYSEIESCIEVRYKFIANLCTLKNRNNDKGPRGKGSTA